MNSQEIRESFLGFFEKKGHKPLPSDSLVPSHDKSLLFTSAGMNQFKDLFLGGKRLPYTRIATCQKCIRTGDLEVVGTTNRHHSFFEMLGNFSFGDYFKKEAIEWGWEYLTKELKIEDKKLFASIYKDDEESFKIWNEVIGLPPNKIYRFDEKDNFWPANAPSQGPDGPCGPCSEIYFDFGSEYGCGKASCQVGCDCGRFTEVWNLVFTQFERKGQNNLVPLKQKNIDTGMGLERLAAVMQKKFSNFETDLFTSIINRTKELILTESANMAEPASLRKISDHIRAVTFCISDGILPSNEERGYVVRRILRQAQRQIHKYGIKNSLLYKLIPVVASTMKKQYPILTEKTDAITQIVKSEEEKFLNTLENGNLKLLESIKKTKSKSLKTIPAEEVFFLYDTYGFPPELTREIVLENGLELDVKGFYNRQEEQRKESRKKSGFSGEIFEKGAMFEIKSSTPETKFTGYEETAHNSKVLGLIKDNTIVDNAVQGDSVSVILDTTPFYAEGGGQIGDTGYISNKNCRLLVTATQSVDERYLHSATVESGEIKKGAAVIAEINVNKRLNIMRNHTATHLLQAALRKVLGQHVEQTGSIVESERLRFDFTHPKSLSADEIRKIEDVVNSEILKDEPVEKISLRMDEAKKMGALMFFGEKYPEQVRVVRTKDNFSVELCGGTHLDRTSIIGLFKITSESSIGSGVRRIEAITGEKAKEIFMDQFDALKELQQILKTDLQAIPDRIKKLIEENDKLKLQVKKVMTGGNVLDSIVSGAKTVKDISFCVFELEGENTPDTLRSLTDKIIQKVNISLLIGRQNEKQFAILGITENIVGKGITSKVLIDKLDKQLGIRGGGKPHMAQLGFSKEISREQLSNELERIVSTL
ncbi:MAG: alanine--tRNA ligase [Planctomycetes bacterium]|nr:alanine--tRNA ligase [Planctomycetota bacterium]